MDTLLRDRAVSSLLEGIGDATGQPFDTSYHPSLLSSLNSHLRSQLSSASAPRSQGERLQALLADCCRQVMTSGQREAVLEQAFRDLSEFYCELNIPQPQRQQQFIHQYGLVMSPDYAIRTVLDAARVSAFWQALSRILPTYQGRECHLVYAACGPFAPLLLPVLLHLRELGELPEQLRITLIDIHPAAATVLQALLQELQLSSMIQVRCEDACHYPGATNSIDILLIEAMQHGLSREGHLNICQHLVPMLKTDGILLPEVVRIEAVLTPANDEYPKDGRDFSQANPQRIRLGTVLELTRDSVPQLQLDHLPDGYVLVCCQSVGIPTELPRMTEQILLLSTDIQVWKELNIPEYASGITHPLPDLSVCIGFTPRDVRPGDLLLSPGDRIRFYYRKFGLPGFLPVQEES